MDHIQALANQVEWAARNLAYNLDLIPADKLNWKPAPTANSALEIVNHVLGALGQFMPLLSGGSIGAPGSGNSNPVSTAQEARQRLIATATEYAQALRKLTPEEMGKKVDLPFGTLPLGFVASMAATDLMHHHGQIAYIQTLLGDTESHFDFSLLPKG